jgi:hypothetical protein
MFLEGIYMKSEAIYLKDGDGNEITQFCLPFPYPEVFRNKKNILR